MANNPIDDISLDFVLAKWHEGNDHLGIGVLEASLLSPRRCFIGVTQANGDDAVIPLDADEARRIGEALIKLANAVAEANAAESETVQ